MLGFRFVLRPIGEIEPWGPESRLHWFGLTDGWYWIELDGHELLRYSDRTLRETNGGGLPYVDYYVVRLWEDILELLPAALEPVPDDLVDLISSDQRVWWRDEDEAEDVIEAAIWYGNHKLDMGYLRNPPHLRWWREAGRPDQMTMAWWHRPREVEFTAPPEGRVTFPSGWFEAAIERLHANC